MSEIIEKIKKYKYSMKEANVYNVLKNVAGTSLSVSDAMKYKVVKAEINGNSYQKTTSGKNKLAILPYENYISNGITTSFDGTTFSYSGTLTSSWFDLCKNYDTNLQAGRYLLSVTSKNLNRVVLAVTYEDGEYGAFHITTNTTKVVVETTKVITKMRLFNDGQTTGDVLSGTVECCMLEPMISGDIPTEYEPFTGGIASPNPDYPSEVEVVEAYNLFDKNTVVNGVLSADGTVTSGAYRTSDYIEIDSNVTYTKNITDSARVKFYDKDKNVISTASYSDIPDFAKELTFTIPYRNARYIRFTIYPDYVDRVQFTKGSEVKPYMPYNNICIKMVGKNLFNTNNKINASINGNIIQTLNDGYTYYAKVKPNTTYTFKRDTLGTNSRSSLGIINKFPEIGDEIIIKTTNLSTLAYTFTTDSDTEYVVMFLNRYATDTLGDNIILTEGTDITYEPNKEKINYIDLQGNFLGKLPDGIKDKAYIKNNHLYLEKKVGKDTFNGNEGWRDFVVEPSGLGRAVLVMTTLKKGAYGTSLKSNKLQCVNYNGSWNLTYENLSVVSSSQNIIIYLKNVQTLEEFKARLSENNVTVYYPLAEPQIIDLGQLEEDIEMLEDTNNITLLSALETDLSMSYYSKELLDISNYKYSIKEV